MRIFLYALLAVLLVLSGCDSGKPVPTGRLEKVLPDGFGTYVEVNVVRNAGGPIYSEAVGHYTSPDRTGTQGIGEDGEIRIVVQDYGGTRESIQLPVAESNDILEYKGLRCHRGFQPGSGVYELRIPIAGRVLLRIEFDDIGSTNELEILDAINWDAVKSVVPDWEGLK